MSAAGGRVGAAEPGEGVERLPRGWWAAGKCGVLRSRSIGWTYNSSSSKRIVSRARSESWIEIGIWKTCGVNSRRVLGAGGSR